MQTLLNLLAHLSTRIVIVSIFTRMQLFLLSWQTDAAASYSRYARAICLVDVSIVLVYPLPKQTRKVVGRAR